MSITYNSTNSIITVSAETNCNFEKLYQADIANGWGVIEKIETSTYRFNAKLNITNSTFEDYSKTIILPYNAAYGANPGCQWIFQGSTVTFGQLRSATEKTAINGINFIRQLGPNNESQRFYMNLSYSSKLYLYGVFIDNYLNQQFAILPYYAGSPGTIKAYSCTFNFVGISPTITTESELVNCKFNKSSYFEYFGYNLENAVFDDARDVFRSFSSLMAATVRNCTFFSGGYRNITIYASGNFNCSFIDNTGLTFNNMYIGWTAGPLKGVLYEKFSIKPTILDIDKNQISGVNIKLYDKNNSLVFDLDTDSNGTITAQDVTVRSISYDKNAGNVITTTIYNPFTLVISKPGYETYTSTFDLTEKYRSIITLSPPEYIYVDKISIVENINPIIIDSSIETTTTTQDISANINEDSITANIISEDN